MKNNTNTFGWVDFNKKDREIALKLIEDNKTQGSIDELGLGTIRDAFSDLFFPGITTIQTRARYFLLVPYWMKVVANKKPDSPEKYQQWYLEKEKNTSKQIFAFCNEEVGIGIFGPDVFNTKRWLVRSIQETYWSGIWKFGFLRNNKGANRLTVSSCARLFVKQTNASSLEVNSDDARLYPGNDNDKNNYEFISVDDELFNIENELENLNQSNDIKLTKKEALFLQKTIQRNASGSLLADVVDSKSSFYKITDFDSINENKYPFIKERLLMAKEYRKLSIFLGKRFSHLIKRKVEEWDIFPIINRELIEKIFDLENMGHR